MGSLFIAASCVSMSTCLTLLCCCCCCLRAVFVLLLAVAVFVVVCLLAVFVVIVRLLAVVVVFDVVFFLVVVVAFIERLNCLPAAFRCWRLWCRRAAHRAARCAQDTFGKFVMVFFDKLGGPVIGLVWRPAAFTPEPFRVSHAAYAWAVPQSTDAVR